MDIRKIHQHISLIAAPTKTNGVVTNIDDDDCAVVEIGTETIVITTDFINSNPAIVELGKGSWYNLGQLVVCHNLADLAGSGCIPKFFLTGICAPSETTSDDILNFIQGVSDSCIKYQCALIGGDTKFGRTRSIFGTAFGIPFSESGPFIRTQAKPGYGIIASGPLGSFGAAVVCLGVGDCLFSKEEQQKAQEILFRTEVPFELAEAIASRKCICAGTDISDGLGTDLKDICSSSKISAYLDVVKIPVEDFVKIVAEKLKVPAWSFAFASGGDFACIYGVPPTIADFCVQNGGFLIGEFEPGTDIFLSSNKDHPLPLIGHIANRVNTFTGEILSNIQQIKDFYDSQTK